MTCDSVYVRVGSAVTNVLHDFFRTLELGNPALCADLFRIILTTT